MPQVHILSPDLISKIAAGEVIERPASVIKELIENSLDAKTDSIDLHLEEAGKTLIRLKDSGNGIAKDDIQTIFQRHATSKISTADDLFNIHSLGFRGEALYSIGAIADVILRSKITSAQRLATSDQRPTSSDQRPATSDQLGWETHIRGGKRLSLKPSSVTTGTEIEVRELFFNTPARRKFLKSNLAEINQILNVFTPYTLLYPQCRFRLTHQDKTLVDLAPTANLRERIAASLALDEKHILDVAHPFPEQNITVRLLLGDINIVRSRRDLQYIFVNGRPVQNKSISFHMNEAYRLILAPHSYPFFSLYITVPAEDIDVNIHPTKREVKIKDEQTLCSILRQMTEQALMGTGGAKQVQILEQTSGNGARTYETSSPAQRLSETLDSPTERTWAPTPTEENSFPRAVVSPEAMQNLFSAPGTKPGTNESLRNSLGNASFIGIFGNKFLLFENGKNLLIVDQHAAQERITFEKLIQQMDKGRVEVQHLLSPHLVRLSVADMLVWEEAKEVFETIGFSCTQFDKETVAVHTYPTLLKDPQKAFLDILAGENPARSDHESLARRACRGSVMAGDPLMPAQAQYIRTHLLQCQDPFTCPHGRPTLISLSEEFLDKQFLRT